MAKRTITIKLDDNTKEFYHNMFLARKLQTWIAQYKALHALGYDDDVELFTDEEILNALSNKKIAKEFLSALEYEEYLKYYSDIYKEIA